MNKAKQILGDASPLKTFTQDAVVTLLSSPKTHGGTLVERVDTHLSHIFLAGNRAYKLKKPVLLNFVDFSTPDQRRLACEREVKVNENAAGPIYRGVLPIVLREGELHLGGDGLAVDWVVEMERFDRSLELDRLADSGVLSEKIIIDLADTIARLHMATVPSRQLGGPSAVVGTIKQISGAIAPSFKGTSRQQLLERWEREALKATRSCARLLDMRRRAGCVRHCHGDLHLANVCLFRGRPVPFDALEFSDEMATTDILYDIAFTLMDLVHRHQRQLANILLNRYLSATRDYAGIRLLPLFMSMRAAVRALANALAGTNQAQQDEAQHFLKHALSELSCRGPARLVAIGGFSGSGKSTLAKLIAPELSPSVGAVILRSDVVRKRVFGVEPEVTLPSNAYHAGVTASVARQFFKDARRALRTSNTVILDATFLRPCHRATCKRLAEQEGVRFDGLWLSANETELTSRVEARSNDASDADAKIVHRQNRTDIGQIDWKTIDAGKPVQTVRDEVLDALEVKP